MIEDLNTLIGNHNKRVEDLLVETDYYVVKALEELVKDKIPQEILSARKELRSLHVNPESDLAVLDGALTAICEKIAAVKIKDK